MTKHRVIPSPQGLEHLRTMERAATYTNEAVSQLYQRYGDIFAFGFGNIRFTWLVGAEAAQCIFQTEAHNLRNHDAYGFLHPIGGDYALITSDEPLHLQSRRVVQPAFNHVSLESIITAHSARLEMLTWRKGDTVDLYGIMRPTILRSICSWLIGDASLERYPTLLGDIGRMMDFANLPFLAQQFKWNVPFSPWRQFIKARQRADHAIYQEIARRRSKSEIGGNDLLAMLLQASLEDGNPLPAQWVRDQTISLISAGFDTSTAGLAWLFYHLLEHPEYLQRVREGIPNILTFKTLNSMEYLELCLKESLRLYPPAPAALRHAATDIQFQDYTIPKGSLLAFSIYVTQRRADYFVDPLLFRPERWKEKKPIPFSYTPFGQGQRYCIGAGLAQLLIKLTVTFLLQRYDFAPAYHSIIDRGNTVVPFAKQDEGAKAVLGLPVTII